MNGDWLYLTDKERLYEQVIFDLYWWYVFRSLLLSWTKIHKNGTQQLFIMEFDDIFSLTPEEKANLSINMSDICVLICAEGIKDRETDISESSLLNLLKQRMKSQQE